MTSGRSDEHNLVRIDCAELDDDTFWTWTWMKGEAVRVLNRFLRSEIGAVVVWILGSILLAALLAPWVCRGGQWLAEVAAVRDLPAVIEWVAESCGRAKLSRFFDRSLLFSALVLLPWLIKRVRYVRRQDAPPEFLALPSIGWRLGLWQCTAGFLVAAVMLAMLCLVMALVGAYDPRPEIGGAGKFFQKVILPAMVVAPLEEWLFRGLLLGIWLRFTRPWAALAGTSVVFSILHFLEPPDTMLIPDPRHPLAGLQMLGGIFLHFAEPLFFVTDFATLLLVGMILGWVKLRTGSLWFGIGLHAGWIVVLKACSFFYTKPPDHVLRPWWVGDSLKSGILPLFVLGMTAAMSAMWLRGCGFDSAESTAQQGDGDDG